MGTGLVIGSRRVQVPGVDVVNFCDDPLVRISQKDRRYRTDRERSWVHLVVAHTTGGIPGGRDLRPQLVRPGRGPSTGEAERIVASWTHDGKRPGGAHLVVDQDGTCYCCADLLDDATYHAERANGCSVGVEVVQGRADADLYQDQLDRAAQLVLWVCRLMPTAIQWQVPTPYEDGPISRFVLSLEHDDEPLADVVGVVGHRDLTASRGGGDPGDAMMSALVAAGCEVVDFADEQDLELWRQRQTDLGVSPADGVPGPKTVAALEAAGYQHGIWREPPARLSGR